MSLLLHNGQYPEFTSLDLDSVILDAAGSGNLPAFSFIVPTRRKLRLLEGDLAREYYTATGKPLEGLPLFTLQSFAHTIYDALAPGKRDVTPEIQIALMERAMNSVDLNYYARDGKRPSAGVVAQITRVLNGIRTDGILPSDFERDIEGAEDMPGYDIVKLRDLHNIYSEYLRLLGDTWIDYPGKLLHVNTELFRERDETFRRAFPDTMSLLIFVFRDF